MTVIRNLLILAETISTGILHSRLSTYFAGFGAEYALDNIGSVGVVVHNVANIDERGVGVYASFSGIPGVNLYTGYAYNDQDGICDVGGDNLINASVSVEKDSFNCAADYVTNGDDDFYAALTAEYNAAEAISVSVTGTAHTTYNRIGDGSYCLKPAVTYTHNTLGAFCFETDVTFTGEGFDSLCFPVYWKYSF
jgi:hypothetical protein